LTIKAWFKKEGVLVCFVISSLILPSPVSREGLRGSGTAAIHSNNFLFLDTESFQRLLKALI
jgi:hypothetical protein